MAFLFKLVHFFAVPAPSATPDQLEDHAEHSVRDSDSSSDFVSFSSLEPGPSASITVPSQAHSLQARDKISQWANAVRRESDEATDELEASSAISSALDVPSPAFSSTPLDWETSTQVSEFSQDTASVASSSPCREIQIEFGSPLPTFSPPSSPASSSGSIFYSFPPFPDRTEEEEAAAAEAAAAHNKVRAAYWEEAEAEWAKRRAARYLERTTPTYARTTWNSARSTSDRYSFRSIYRRVEPSMHSSIASSSCTIRSHSTLEIREGDQVVWPQWPQQVQTWRSYLLREQRRAIAAERERTHLEKRSTGPA
ncbi:hypothetical protein JCM3774_001020 [Rhodotorula dairenensis]